MIPPDELQSNLETAVSGSGVSVGIAIGTAFNFRPMALKIPQRPVAVVDQETEMQRFYDARIIARDELSQLQIKTADRAGHSMAAIFEGHTVLLYDPMLEDAIRARVASGRIIEAALQDAVENLAQALRALDDRILSARAADMEDIGKRLLRLLLNVADTSLEALISPAIIVTHDLSPSDTANLDPGLVLGICLSAGSITSHAAILARTMNIPAVFGLGRASIESVINGQPIAMDGSTGHVYINPTEKTLAYFKAEQERITARRIDIRQSAERECYTADGVHIAVIANIGDLESAEQSVALGAEGIGLLRTEFLFMNAPTPPSEEQQITTYRAIFEAMEGRPVTIRTLDLGGDKPPRFMVFPRENNPYLGWRGIRVSLDNPDLFKTQLRAILRAALGFNVQVMYPMIESITTLRLANQLFAEVRAELDAEGIEYPRGLPTGTMIETPAAAIQIDAIARETEFFSIGTNDLTQYTLAVDRDGDTVTSYFRPLTPAILWLIDRVIETANKFARPVTLCGELASIPAAIPVLLGLGLERFSVVPPAVPQTKWIISHFSIDEARTIARRALAMPTASDIEGYVNDELRKRGLV